MNYVSDLGFAVCKAHAASNAQKCHLKELDLERFNPYHQFITELNFAQNKLSSLPENLFTAFPSLRVLSLEKNKVSILPGGMSKCFSLHSLFLKQNQLKNLPFELSECGKLQYLDISCNPFDELPDVIFNCRSLIELNLADIGFSNLPDKISQLEKLEILNLAGNLLTDLPAEMENLKRLTHLDISGVEWIKTGDKRKALLTKEAYENIASIHLPLAKLKDEV